MSDLDFPNLSDEEDPPPERRRKKTTKTRDNPDPALILTVSEATRRGVPSAKRGSAGKCPFHLAVTMLMIPVEKENSEKETAKLKKQLKALQKKLVAESELKGSMVAYTSITDLLESKPSRNLSTGSGPESEDSDEDESVMTSFPNTVGKHLFVHIHTVC